MSTFYGFTYYCSSSRYRSLMRFFYYVLLKTLHVCSLVNESYLLSFCYVNLQVLVISPRIRPYAICLIGRVICVAVPHTRG